VKRMRATIGMMLASLVLATSAQAQSGADVQSARKGMSWQQGQDAAWYLDQHKRLATAIAALKPERKKIVDAYVLVVGLDGDPVFGKEAAETARVLSRRYDAVGHTILLATGTTAAADGSPPNVAAALAAMAGKMNRDEDVLVLYATAHGAPGIGIVYKDGDKGYGYIAAERLSEMLTQLGIKKRLILISACYSGQFINDMATTESVILTASDDDKTSFGCAPGNDWTFFGDAMINNALRKPVALEPAAAEAFGLIAEWEKKADLTPSEPRLFVGPDAKGWLAALEKKLPAATARVGRPATEEAKPAIVGR
jgi:Peptidase C13 family